MALLFRSSVDSEAWDCPGLVDTLSLSPEVLPMPRTRPPYSPEFRRQMVDLVRAGRNPDDLAREFEPSGPADYAMFVDTQCVALAEAKRRRKNVSAAIDQAERYSRGFTPSADITV